MIIYFTAKDNNFKISDEHIADLYLKNPELKDYLTIKKIANNKIPLTKLYNSLLSELRNSNANEDFIAFMHADVSLDIASFVKHINECKEKYDVFGLCGCAKLSAKQSPLNWWCGSNPYPNSRYGYVIHGELNNHASFFNAHSPNVTDHAVACIDGLCIVFGKKAICSDMKFDELFTYDLYDTDLSFQCAMKYGFRIGVIVEKSLNHYSVGKSILTDDFLKHEIDFRKKWNLSIPEGSKLQQLVKDMN